jgi:cyclophilin family peptidyl-prolyl cis-trans isomerase/HEAT repeat protein
VRRPAAPNRAPLLALLLLAAGCGEGRAPSEEVPTDPILTFRDIAPDPEAFGELLEVEDRRAARPGDLGRLEAGAASPHPGIRRVALRALGRLEGPAGVETLVAGLGDPDPGVRGEAANALAQAARGSAPEGVERIRRALAAATGEETDGAALGALARSLGRLPLHGDGDVAAGARELLAIQEAPAGSTASALLGVTRGALFLHRARSARRAAGAGAAGGADAGSAGVAATGAGDRPDPSEPAVLQDLAERLAALSRGHPAWTVRLGAAQALRASGDVPGALAGAWLQDDEAEVRREGAAALMGDPGGASAASLDSLLARALEDPVDRVRVEGVRSAARLRRAGEGCALLLAAARDASDHVALVALEALAGSPQAGPCPEADGVPALLDRTASALPPRGETGWHRPARALVALARLDPDGARAHLPRYLAHPHPFVRAHGARVAGILGERDLLELAEDPDSNVREAAVEALGDLPGGVPLPVLHAQLERDDPMLLRTTARHLEGREEGRPRDGPSREEVAAALLAAVERVTARGEMTSRDARLPLLRQVGAWGRPADADRVEPFLRDFDPRVAEEAARILAEWTGTAVEPAPEPRSGLPLPDVDALRAMETLEVEVEMVSGGVFVLGLLPFEAPTNAARFLDMAREGTFDGLTLHRVVPNFVVQGGSPGANEYAGHGAYTRDERGLPGHWRGTVGISTRGRDTGDGQIFVNLVSNLRLDHDYTVFARVLEGMEVVDAVQEGDRMAAVRIRGEGP